MDASRGFVRTLGHPLILTLIDTRRFAAGTE
jgi:hypothetical protein